MAAKAPRAPKTTKLTLVLTEGELRAIDKARKTATREAYIKKLLPREEPLADQVQQVMQRAKTMPKAERGKLLAKPKTKPVAEREASKIARDAVRKHRDEKAQGRI